MDDKFKPIVSIEMFLGVQKMNKPSTSWHKSDSFLPFRNYVKCEYCGNYMTPGRSTGSKGEKYLYLSCGNKKCISALKVKKEKANRVRAFVLVDFIKEYIKQIDIDTKLYNDVM